MGRASYMCGMAFACTRPGEPCVQVNANRATHRPTNGKSTVRRQSMQKVAVRCEDFRSQATYIGVSRPPWRLATPTRKAGRRLTVVRTRSLSRDPPSPALFLPVIFPASAVAQDRLQVRSGFINLEVRDSTKASAQQDVRHGQRHSTRNRRPFVPATPNEQVAAIREVRSAAP